MLYTYSLNESKKILPHHTKEEIREDTQISQSLLSNVEGGRLDSNTVDLRVFFYSIIVEESYLFTRLPLLYLGLSILSTSLQ